MDKRFATEQPFGFIVFIVARSGKISHIVSSLILDSIPCAPRIILCISTTHLENCNLIGLYCLLPDKSYKKESLNLDNPPLNRYV